MATRKWTAKQKREHGEKIRRIAAAKREARADMERRRELPNDLRVAILRALPAEALKRALIEAVRS